MLDCVNLHRQCYCGFYAAVMRMAGGLLTDKYGRQVWSPAAPPTPTVR